MLCDVFSALCCAISRSAVILVDDAVVVAQGIGLRYSEYPVGRWAMYASFGSLCFNFDTMVQKSMYLGSHFFSRASIAQFLYNLHTLQPFPCESQYTQIHFINSTILFLSECLYVYLKISGHTYGI